MKKTIVVLLGITAIFLFTCGVDPLSYNKETGAPHGFVCDSLMNNPTVADTSLFSKRDTVHTGDSLTFFGFVYPVDSRVKGVAWNLADGKKDSQPVLKYAYAHGGIYHATFSIFDSVGNTLSDTVSVFVNTRPDSVGSILPSNGATNQSLTPHLAWKGYDQDDFDSVLAYTVILILENGTTDTIVRWYDTTNIDLNRGLEKGQKISWYVLAKDRFGDVVASDTLHFNTLGSDDATLAKLQPSLGNLAPAFSPNDTMYYDTVAYTTSAVSITALSQEKRAMISINHTALGQKDSSASVSLSKGTTEVAVEVKAPDGITKKTYTLRIFRRSNSDATLRSLTIFRGNTPKIFSSLSDTVNDTTSFSDSLLRFNPILSDSQAFLTVASSEKQFKSILDTIPTKVGINELRIKVLAADSISTKTYLVRLVRKSEILSLFTVTFDGQGATIPSNPTRKTVISPATTIDSLPTPPNKTGFHFGGWFTQISGGGTAFTASSVVTANDTVYAKWTLNPTYTVTYDGNGKTGGTVPIDANIYQKEDPVTVLGNTGNLVKTGSTFVGWNTKADGTGTSFAGRSTFTMDTANITLFAKWTANPTYTVTYDGNGKTGGMVPIDANSYQKEDPVTVIGNTGNLVKTGSTFVGWNTKADGSGTSYAGRATFTMDTVNVTLYAKWTVNSTYTVTYDGNEKTSGAVPTDANSYQQEDPVTVLGNTGNLLKTGSTFAGWNTKADGSGTSYAGGATFAMGTGNVTLYAKWTANPTYTVMYDGNGKTSGSEPIDANHYQQSDIVTVLGNTGNLLKTGSTFAGWNTKTDGTGTSYAGGATFPMGTANVMLYAKWTADPTYTVTYDGNGKTGGSVPIDANHYQQSDMVTVLGNSGNLLKTGSTFAGWNTKTDGTGTSYAGGATFPMGTANVMLYAKWTADPTYSVTYDGNGKTSGSEPIDANHYQQSDMVTVLGNSGNLVKTGSTFAGWNTKTDGTGTSYAGGATFPMGTANVMLYAKWTADPTYTVTYDGNGKTGGSVPIDANHYQQSDIVTVLGNSGNLVKNGSTFAGWNTSVDGTGTSFAGGATFPMGTVNVILYAKWTANSTYTVTYEGNGKTGGSVPIDANHYQQSDIVTVLGNSGNLVKNGSTFAGWNTSVDGTGTSYAGGATFPMGTANVMLYAKWTANSTYIVAYDGNGKTSGSAPIDANHYQQSDMVTVLGNSGNLVKTGSTFAGWNTKTDGTGTSYAGGATFPMGTVNVILYAKWTANPTFTITYDGNGKTGGSAPIDANHYQQSDLVIVLGNSGNLVKNGSTFAGWNTKTDGTGTSYAGGATFPMGTANVMLYAKWTANSTYTVTYDGNGKTGGSAPIDANHYQQSDLVIVLGNSGNLVKNGSTFAGWNTKTDGTGTSYAGGATFPMGTANVMLYAKWTANSTYTVTYDGNGKTSGSEPVDANHYQQSDLVIVLGNTGNLVKNGSTFTGWNTKTDGTGTSYAGGATFPMGTANVMLYAKWTANSTYTVTYDGNGKTSGSEPIDANHYQQSDIVTVLGNTGNLVKTGSTFAGWNTKTDGTGTSYAGGATFPMGTANVMLYAKWTANSTYTVTYDGNGKTSGSEPVDANHYQQSDLVIVLGNTGNLVKNGSTFAGWNTSVDGTGTNYAGGATFPMGTVNVILYAKWTVNPTYTVTYDGNGNASGNAPIDENHYQQSDVVTVLGNTGNLFLTGSTFAGWNTKANGTGASYAGGATFPMGTVNVILYAKWTVNPTYTMTYDGNGNTSGNAPIDGNHYQQSDVVTVLGNTGNLFLTGSTFAGWNTKANGTGASYAGGATFPIGTTNDTLFAKWTANIDTITFYKNDPNAIGSMTPQPIASGSSATLFANGFTKTGWSFAGWATSFDGAVVYADGASYTMGTANANLFAKWTANTYTVTFHPNDPNASGTMTPQPIASGSSATLIANGFTKAGWSFAGWATSFDGAVVYSDGASYTMGTANANLFAKWTANIDTITFNKNDPNAIGSMPPQTIASGSSANLTLSAFTNPGWSFVGWATSFDGAVVYADGAIFTMGTANTDLYAKWIPQYTVNFYSQGSVVTSQTIDSGATATNVVQTRPGFSFGGWFKEAECINHWIFTFDKVIANTDIFAKWIPQYTVTFDPNDGTTQPTVMVVDSATTVIPFPNNPSNNPSYFAGWFIDLNDTSSQFNENSVVTGNINVVAKWDPPPP